MLRFFLRIKWRTRWRCATGHDRPYAWLLMDQWISGLNPDVPPESKEDICFKERRHSVIYSRFHSTSDSGTIIKSKVEFKSFGLISSFCVWLIFNFTQTCFWILPNALMELVEIHRKCWFTCASDPQDAQWLLHKSPEHLSALASPRKEHVAT